MRVTHLFCDGCGKEVSDISKERIYTLQLTSKDPINMIGEMFGLKDQLPELCEECGDLLKTILQKQTLQKWFYSSATAESVHEEG